MTRSYQRVCTGDLRAIYKHANATCNNNIKRAIDEALSDTVIVAKMMAPIYHPEQWLLWWGFEHHYTPPGTLKRSIYSTRTTCQGRGVTFKAKFGASARFASCIEGGFKHKRARRKIPGKFFLTTSTKLVLDPAVQRTLKLAVRRMFTLEVV